MRTLVLLNPGAGSAGERDALRRALARLPAAKVHETRSGEDVRTRAREARSAGFDRVVAAGGDGTIHLAVNGLAEADDPAILGVLPLGTANDFARSLGLPRAPQEAMDVLVSGVSRRIDLVAAQGRTSGFFANVAVGGFGGRIRESADPARKRVLGSLEYLRSAAEELPDLTAHRVVVELDGERFAVDVYHILVANGMRSGGNIPVAPEARLDDGLVDVVLIPALPTSALLVLVSKILIGKHVGDSNIVYRKAKAVSFRAEPRMRFSLDGEAFGRDPVEFRVVPGALEVAAPPPSEAADARGQARAAG